MGRRSSGSHRCFVNARASVMANGSESLSRRRGIDLAGSEVAQQAKSGSLGWLEGAVRARDAVADRLDQVPYVYRAGELRV